MGRLADFTGLQTVFITMEPAIRRPALALQSLLFIDLVGSSTKPVAMGSGWDLLSSKAFFWVSAPQL